MFAEPSGAPAVVLEKIGCAVPGSLLQLALAQGWFVCSHLHQLHYQEALPAD